jgi:hypothetical protein
MRREPADTLPLPHRSPPAAPDLAAELTALSAWAWERWRRAGDRWDLRVAELALRASEALRQSTRGKSANSGGTGPHGLCGGPRRV